MAVSGVPGKWNFGPTVHNGVWPRWQSGSYTFDGDPWDLMYQGQYSFNPLLVNQAMLLLLQREQQAIVQPSWNVFHVSGIPTIVLSAFTSSHLPSGAGFTSVMGPFADVTVYKDRWSWINDPAQGMWLQWRTYGATAQAPLVDIPLWLRAPDYSAFYWYSPTYYPIIW